jgi:hypothetical protein
MRNTADVTDGKLIVVRSQCISGESAVNPIAAFYDIYGFMEERGVILFYCPGHHTRHYYFSINKNNE